MNKTKELTVIGLYGVIVITIGLLDAAGLTRYFRQGITQLSLPVTQFGIQLLLFFEKPVVIARDAYQAHVTIQDLELRYAESLAEVGRLSGVETENRALRSYINNSDVTQRNSIITRPIVAFGDPGVATSGETFPVGTVVLVEGMVVGRIETSSSAMSKVSLLFQEKTQPLVVKTTAGAAGVTRGTGRVIEVTEVSINTPVSVGELVVTAGQEGVKPDLAVGTVREVIREPTSSTQTLILDQPVSFYNSAFVEVYL